MRFRFVRPDTRGQAITSQLPTLQQLASEVVPALKESSVAEWGRRGFGERS
jgi:hypothetical protein